MSDKSSVEIPAKQVVIDPNQILTLEDVAARLKVSERWVYEKTRLRCRNPLPCIRMGRYLRFHWIDVSAWLVRHSNVTGPGAECAA
jgi:hypothetical protein